MRIGFSLLSSCLLLLTFLGCGDGSSEQKRLEELAANVEQNSERVQEISSTMNGLDDRLATIESSLQKFAGSWSQFEKSPSESADPSSQNLTDVENLSKQMAFLMEKFAAMNQELASTKDAMERTAAKITARNDIGGSLFELANDPQKFAEGFERLIERVSPRFEDEAVRQAFEGKIAQLHNRVLNPPSPEELYDDLYSRHLERLSATSDGRRKKAIQGEINKLENLSGQELLNYLGHISNRQNVGELFQITKTFGLKIEDLVESWFDSSGRK